jgi:hypothetical protein
MGAMGDAFASGAATAAPMDINPADAALGSAMDSAMDQGGAPAPGEGQPAMDDSAGSDIVDPGMDEEQADTDGDGLAG